MNEFFHAIWDGNEGEVIRMLDADPALLERVDHRRVSPLIKAIQVEQVAVVRLLVHRGANVNVPAAIGALGALDSAMWRGNEEIAAFLLSHGARADVGDDMGMTPVMLACERNDLSMAHVIAQHMETPGVQHRDSRGQTALHWAAMPVFRASGAVHRVHRLALAACLLSKGAQAEVRDECGKTPLMRACGSGHIQLAQMLLQHTAGRGLEHSDEGGLTALSHAAGRGHEEMVRFLLLAGADPTIRDDEGRTAHQFAEEARGWLPTECARVVAVFEWWEGELERCYLLSRATCLHKAYTTQRDMPTSQVPTYLEARVAAGHAVPRVEVMSPQAERQIMRSAALKAAESGKRKAAGEGVDAQGSEAMSSMLEYVVKALNEELITELLEGFHGGK